MKQAIPGVAPPDVAEVTIMTVCPTFGASGAGRFLGRLYSIQWGIGIFSLGKLIALASIPLAIGLYFARLQPFTGRLYRLTNRRVLIETIYRHVVQSWVELDRFDTIEVVVQPGQEWYRSGDLVFRMGQIETFRLIGVSRPETFRRTCLDAHRGYVGVRNAGS